MTNRDNALWLQFWRDQRSDFHQINVNQLLIKFWPAFDAEQSARVFVPLCGKSLDMLWLAEQGYQVVGVELSPVAVKAFFRENNLRPTRKIMGHFTVWTAGNISILCGDYFSLLQSDLGQIDIVYDRAALTALPEDIRIAYVAQLRNIVAEDVQIFLLTAEDVEIIDHTQQQHAIDQEINTLYAKFFNIALSYVETVLEPEQTLYKVYQLSPK